MNKLLTSGSLVAFLALLSIPNAQLAAAPLGTAFTYQGQLQQSGSPAQGLYELRSLLYDSETSGSPISAVLTNAAVPVTNGIFTVTLDFGAGVFNGQARWLELGVRPVDSPQDFTALLPRQQITAVPYATYAQEAARAGTVTGTVSTAQLTGTLAPTNIADATITGAMLAPGSVGTRHLTDGYQLLTINPAGWVGIGTADPGTRLHLAGWDSQYHPALRISGGSEELGSGLLLENTYAGIPKSWALYTHGTSGTLNFLNHRDGLMVLSLATNGCAGIGTANPSSLLSLGNSLDNTKVALWDSGDRNRLFGLGVQAYQFRLHLAAPTGRFSFLDAPAGNELMTVNGDGWVGIGTTNPLTRLHIADWDSYYHAALRITSSSAGFGSGVFLENTHGGINRLWSIYNNGTTGDLVFGYETDSLGVMTLGRDGTTSVRVLQITGGADIAEPFRVAPQDPVSPGQVVCIDPNQPGALRRSTKAYDPTVAGIVSGANGIKSGMMLRQEESVADGTHPVALTGRVWCWCDAESGGTIQPGDLLTTADTPGHAMRAVDRQRAPGAILGKAMSSLEQGRGLVLVLVSLQ